MELTAYQQQYERWVNVGQTVTDFLAYLIALMSTGVEDSLEPIHQGHRYPESNAARDCTAALGFRGNDIPGWSDHQRSILRPVVDHWHLRARRLDQTVQMASVDMQYWTQRLIQSWIAALTLVGPAVTRGEPGSTD